MYERQMYLVQRLVKTVQSFSSNYELGLNNFKSRL